MMAELPEARENCGGNADVVGAGLRQRVSMEELLVVLGSRVDQADLDEGQ